MVGEEGGLCVECQLHLPETDYARRAGNATECRLAGRVPFAAAMSLLVFTMGGTAQQVVHNIKYREGRKLARVMGRRMGQALADGGRFASADMLLPVPLHRSKERRREYNQSALLCQGMADVLGLPVETRALRRTVRTATQTHKSREQRATNMQHVFSLRHPQRLAGRHVLLVDDVLTTGATLAACWEALQAAPGLRISVATLAIAGEE